MGIYEENYLDKRPQSLCKMCGKCCRISTSSIPYETIKKRAVEGDKSAKEFLDIFVPYNSIEDAKKVNSEVVENIIGKLISDNKYNPDDITFYHCKFIQDNNLCSKYESRYDVCRHFPSTPWAIVPPNCGFEGWLFWKREEIKQKIRKQKEELLELKLLKQKNKNPETFKKIELVEQKLLRNINLYKEYGSDNW